jgi:hypothetical protein
MNAFEKHYIDYFTSLIQEFVRDVESLPHPDIKRMPEPHLPLFGKNYENSTLRLVVIGQDTLDWGDLRDFVTAEKATPGCKLHEGLDEFRDHSLFQQSRGTASSQRFLGFMMMMVAALHGQENWALMKHGKMPEILDSLAWAEVNAVRLYGDWATGLGVPYEYWGAVRRVGERFNRFRHIAETLKPHAALVLYRGLDPASYFEGYKPKIVLQDGRLTQYHLPEIGVDVYHTPHPGSMNRIEGIGHFRDRLKELFERHGLTAAFPEFLAGQEGGCKVMEYLRAKAPEIGDGYDKFEFVAWVSEELTKRQTFMSVPALMELVNAKGGRTNNGERFSGGRGSYRLVSGSYWRMMAAKRPETAHNVAVAFRRPNFEYAYNCD